MYSNTFREIRKGVYVTYIFYFFLIVLICTTVYFTAKMFAEKYTPMKDANFIDIFNSEEVALRRGATVNIPPAPTVIESIYADKGIVYKPEKHVYRKSIF